MAFNFNKLRMTTLGLIAITLVITFLIPPSQERQIITHTLLGAASLLAIIDCLLYRKQENFYQLTLLGFILLLVSQLWLLYIAIF